MPVFVNGLVFYWSLSADMPGINGGVAFAVNFLQCKYSSVVLLISPLMFDMQCLVKLKVCPLLHWKLDV